jgi:hypothetical protein
MTTKNLEKLQAEVDKTLLLLEKNEDAKVNPFFYTRLAAKLNEAPKNSGSAAAEIFDNVKFAVVIPLACALMLLFSIWSAVTNYNAADENKETRKNELIKNLRMQYNSTTGSSVQEDYGDE